MLLRKITASHWYVSSVLKFKTKKKIELIFCSEKKKEKKKKKKNQNVD